MQYFKLNKREREMEIKEEAVKLKSKLILSNISFEKIISILDLYKNIN